MNKPILLMALLTANLTISAQNLPKRAEQRAKDKTAGKVDESVDKGIDSAFSKTGRAISGIFSKKDKSAKETSPAADNSAQGNSGTSTGIGSGKTSGTAVKGESDFIPGVAVIFEDRFSQDAMGDFPAKWNTNGSGKVVTLTTEKFKWLEVVHNSIVAPVLDKSLPENCTIEFDLFLRADGDHSTPFIQFGLSEVRDVLKEDMGYRDRFFINLHRYAETDGKTLEYGFRNDIVGNKSDFPLTSYVNNTLHVAIAINKTRIRLYLDDKKIIDLPKALTPGMRNTFFINNNQTIPASEIGLLVTNIRIANADTDARSLLLKQLMETGSAVTNEILFDVNSDHIKKESFPIIDQIGNGLVQNAALKISIVGHTDNDGADLDNLVLSQKRAAAVKLYLTENFAVAGSRIITEGRGEKQPVAPNTTAEGKAKNRRVEFIKR
ncbi:OmpA family protein [Flavihumibacter petaseus]|uniref:OmpA family protein n=1 Tax=Flavihumibacter petaseus NBRC 106054 TaxID=1220578 RepID=A0A0E9N3K4_9BACT|nr:OmpA family protein [Flavihumibacter petaseus]GAO44266.1 OmpA family protein [Flavihumibacter petaseus NBRC 106054]